MEKNIVNYNKMRLEKEYIDYIKRIAKDLFGEDTKVYLFGSRIDKDKKGGDIDIYVETNLKKNIFDKKIELLKRLHDKMGEQKIDVVINNNTTHRYIYEVARHEGILL